MLIDLGCGADRLRARAPDAKDRLQRDLGMLVVRNVDSRDAAIPCSVYSPKGKPEIIA